MKTLNIVILIILLGVASHSRPFWCPHAKTNVEKRICRSVTLSQYDDKINKVYKITKNSLSGWSKKEFVRKQRQWIKDRDRYCKNEGNQCVENFYKNRIREIQAKGYTPQIDRKYTKQNNYIQKTPTPPQVSVINTAKSVNSNEAKLTLLLKDMGSGIGNIDIFLNGNFLTTDTRALTRVKSGSKNTKIYLLKLSEGTNSIRIKVFDRTNSVHSRIVSHSIVSTRKRQSRYTNKSNIVRGKNGEKITEYVGSYALIIGVSNYTNGWPDLDSVPSELQNVKSTLENKGFVVTNILDPNSKELQNAFEDFVDKYGYDKHNRLLFFYSGHGYSTNNGSKGYLVPIDAPSPQENIKGFKIKSLNMSSLLALSRNMEVNHALFLFDSCFSGTIFKTKSLPKTSAYIKQVMSKPVRQYITAGSAGEEVPAKSTFTPMFLDAINGLADLNNDGYITGSELGMYLATNVPKYTNQSPQYGKIQDYELSRGDFIFLRK